MPGMSTGLVVQVLVTGVAAGAAYGLVGIGVALVYRLTGIVQLAQGELLGGATFLALVLAAGRSPVTRTSVPIRLVVASSFLAVVVAAVAGAVLYLVLLRPFLRRGAAIGWVAVLVALALAVEGLLTRSFPREGYVFPDLFPVERARPINLGSGASVPVRTFYVLAVVVLVAVVVERWLARSRTGKAMEAVADDREAAEIVGLPVDRLVATAFALATALAAVAGIVLAPGGTLTPQSGVVMGLKGIAAALVAGLAGPRRVLLAGLAVGVAEAAVTSLPIGLGPEWRDLTALVLALLAVAVRPPHPAVELVE